MCYIQFGVYPNHMHIKIIVKKKQLVEKKKGKKGKRQQHRC
jgi:hypothetical protein